MSSITCNEVNYTARQESWAGFKAYWADPGLHFPCVFVSPAFLESWWQAFHEKDAEPFITTIMCRGEMLGIAPLKLRNGAASFIGDAAVLDYLDFITAPGREGEFLKALLDYLEKEGIKELELGPVRHDSLVMTGLKSVATERGYRVEAIQEDVTLEMALPGSWDEYLLRLGGKERHELRRKLRRLYAAGSVTYQVIDETMSIMASFDDFLGLFGMSRGKKASFMTDRMATFFRALAGLDLVRLGSLSLAGKTIAMVMCFDYKDVIYLYNAAYDLELSALSPGIVSKALYIHDSIEKGKKVFNFLKGSETYKYQMGGKEIPIYRCRLMK